MVVYIALNGPPGAGKSTIAKELVMKFNDKGYKAIQDSLAAPMKHFIATSLAEKYDKLNKDVPMDILMGDSPRRFLINLSEDYVKPRYGQDFWVRAMMYRALRYSPPPNVVIVDDIGFKEEADALGSQLVLVHVMRANTSFANDSRSWLPNPHFIINNHTNMDELWITCRALVTDIITHLNGPAPL